MKKGFFAVVVILFIGGVIFSGCIKNKPYNTTTNPSMTAKIGGYNFVANNVITATLDSQMYDSTNTLIITGTSSDRAHPYDKIELWLTSFKNTSGVFSIVQSQARAYYYHNGRVGNALGGVVTITSYAPNTLTGYFSFTTDDTVSVKDGAFTANRP